MGWNLGVTETFAGIIVVGLAVDYVVHQAHMYEDAAHCEYHYQTREERFKHSATKMGSTVIAGAITTAGSGSFMFLCQLGFFRTGFVGHESSLPSTTRKFALRRCEPDCLMLIGPSDINNPQKTIRPNLIK